MSAEAGTSGAPGSNSPTSMIISNSPPHSGSVRSPKRLCLGTGLSASPYYSSSYHYGSSTSYASSAASSSSSSQHNSSSSTYFKPIRSTEIAEQIREEMLRLRMIRHRTSSTSTTATAGSTGAASAVVAGTVTTDGSASTSVSRTNQSKSDAGGNKSPSPSESSMSSGGDQSPGSSPRRPSISTATPSSSSNTTSPFALYRSLINANDKSKGANLPHSTSASTSSAGLKRSRDGSNTGAGATSTKQPLFTFEQVVLIVERLLAEKESALNRQFEQTLASRLSEQYEQFVKFSYDTIQRRFDSQALPSYLS